MKKLLLLLFLISSNAQSSMVITDFSIQPGNNITTATDIFVSYDVVTSNLSSLYSPTEITIFDNEIVIDIFIVEGPLTAVGGVSENLFIGKLSANSYDFSANFNYGRTWEPSLHLETVINEQINVSAVPLPGAVWFFISGLAFLGLKQKPTKVIK